MASTKPRSERKAKPAAVMPDAEANLNLTVGAFYAERTQESPTHINSRAHPAKAFFDAYTLWCRRKNLQPIPAWAFRKESERFIKRTGKIKGVIRCQGRTILPAPVPGEADKAKTEQPAIPAADEPDHIKLVHETNMLEADVTGSDDASAARASALRAILIDGLDAKSTEWRIKQQWPHLKDTAAAIVESAQRKAEGWKPGAIRTIGGMQKRITSVDQINERFVMITIPGQPSCIAQISDALFLTRDDFSARLGDSVIVIGVDNKGAVQTKDAAKVWAGDCRRRAASKIVFTSRKTGPKCFNLWTGFGVTPKAGKCDLVHRHIDEVICAGNAPVYDAFLNLIAWQAQNIGKSSRTVVDLFSKEQQTGKGVLLEKILTPMFGLHGLFTADSGKVFGRFNDAIRGKAYVAFDEACFAGDRQLADKIKSASGTETTSIEGKGLPVIACPTATNWYMATNRPHSAHIEWDDARYWILRVSKHRKGDDAYWAALFKEINEGGVSAFLHDMLARDVSNFIPSRDVPRDNDEHRANKRASDPTNPALWLLECLDNGMWLGSDKWESPYSPNGKRKDLKGALSMSSDGSDAKMLPAFLEDAYREWAKTQGRHAQAAAAGEFWGLLTELGFESKKSGGRRCRLVPDHGELRAKIKERWGVGDDDDATSDPKGTVGTVGDGKNQLSPKITDKCTTTGISPGFSGESAILLTPTDPKTERAVESTIYQGSVAGGSRRDSRDSRRGETGSVGTVVDSRGDGG